MAMDNRDIVAKAQMSVEQLQTDGGYMPEAVAREFFVSIVKQGVLLKLVKVSPMTSPQMTIPKIKFGGPILHAAKSSAGLPESLRSRPETDKVTLTAKEFKSEIRLDYDTIEDNIEGEALQNKILDMMKDRIAYDMDLILTLSDTSSTNPDYAQMDGIFKQCDANIVDANGASASKALFQSLMVTLPQEYRANKRDVVFLVPDRAELDYRNSLAERGTVGGDRWLAEDVPVMFGGSSIKSIPCFPENLGQTANRGSGIYTDPKNINIGMWKNVKFEMDRDISAGEVIIVARVRWDAKLQEKRAAVKATNILCA